MADHLRHFKAAEDRAIAAVDQLIAMADTETRRTTNEGIKTNLLGFFAVAERSIALGLKKRERSCREGLESRSPACACEDCRCRNEEGREPTSRILRLQRSKRRRLPTQPAKTLTTGALIGLVFAFGLWVQSSFRHHPSAYQSRFRSAAHVAGGDRLGDQGSRARR